MYIGSYSIYFLDHEKLRKEVRSILKANKLKQEDVAKSIGYTQPSLNNYLRGDNDSRFIAGALLERFNLNTKDYERKF